MTPTRTETLAIDLGSTGVRAARFGPDGRRIGPVAARRHRGGGSAPGRVRPESLLAAVLDTIGKVDLAGVGAVAVSALWHSALALDAESEPVGEAVTWEAAMPERVRATVEAAAADWSLDVSGAYPHSSYAVAAFPLLYDERVDRFADLGSWITERLTGRRLGWSPTMAAASGLWRQDDRAWNRPLFAALGLPEHLIPPLWTDPVEGDGTVPGLAGAIWLPTAGDGLCHNIGHAAVGPGTIAVTVGTSGSVRALLPGAARAVPGLWRYRCADDLDAVGGAVTSAGNALEWVRRFTGTGVDWGRYSGDPVLPPVRADPAVYGRRGPDYPWDATASISGLGPSSTLDDVRDAFAIDLWRDFRAHFTSMRPLLDPEPVVRAAGGVINGHHAGAQLLADALATPVELVDVDEASLAGAGVVGAQFLRDGLHDLPAAAAAAERGELGACRTVRLLEPRAAWTERLEARWRP
ncbi:FGGY-family carbohydrate kinase [Glycomyces harbinensis]|uniref:Gluconokinase n=1 Tax=Glycomyces harbinensis TaxID=58114 RepID=A0A1G6UAW2_9ACTN|nr:FGGY-family carbohydrate kinase [Glycomyces harbinensis]SDD38401.1 gluconokinase [Glycomyces harbinensis]